MGFDPHLRRALAARFGEERHGVAEQGGLIGRDDDAGRSDSLEPRRQARAGVGDGDWTFLPQ
jgi:hypothetical protein